MSHPRLLATLLLSLALAGCGDSAPAPAPAPAAQTVEGWLLDPTYRPIAGAQVLGGPRRGGQGPAGHRVNLSGLSAVMTSDGRSDGRPATSAAVRRAAAGAVWNP